MKYNLTDSITHTQIPVEIVYEDDAILVVNKSADTAFAFPYVNLLDSNTTGLAIIAKQPSFTSLLDQMILNKEVKWEYLAIVRDKYLPDMGIINAPIGPKEGSSTEHTIDFIHGKRAITQYQVLGRENGYAFVSLFLETQRTHQIRLHMKYMKCPLVGDGLYNPNDCSYLSQLKAGALDTRLVKRQALHSFRLEFLHPVTKKPLCFTQKLPDDMIDFLIQNMSFFYEEYR
ncbi:MAG: RluA family pseudouridine synthase [Lachnospiraceae bacterium]